MAPPQWQILRLAGHAGRLSGAAAAEGSASGPSALVPDDIFPPCTMRRLPCVMARRRWNAKGEGGVGNASYVFLPLLPTGGDPAAFKLAWVDKWRLGDYKPVAPS